jgi:hypothetical protein
VSLRIREEIQEMLRRGDGELSALRAEHLFRRKQSAIEAAIQAGRQKIDLGFEGGRAVVNG